MSQVGQKEILTQKRVIRFFRDQLGYDYLGDWTDREGNSNIDEELLADWLRRRGYSDKVIDKVLYHLGNARMVSGSRTLYDANREVYGMLRYGVKVRPDVGEQTVTVWLIDWEHPENNDFAIAEEVTVGGVHDKRPDLVLYVNGIALGVLELKRSTVSVTEGIRQNLDNQKKDFIRPFFATVQLVMAGNDTEGLWYGVIETAEKYYLTWKEDSQLANPLDRALSQLCRQDRLLEIIHDFTVFDANPIARRNRLCVFRPIQFREQIFELQLETGQDLPAGERTVLADQIELAGCAVDSRGACPGVDNPPARFRASYSCPRGNVASAFRARRAGRRDRRGRRAAELTPGQPSLNPSRKPHPPAL